MIDFNDPDVKKTYLSFLVSIIKADHKTNRNELKFLLDVAKKLDFSEEALENLLHNPGQLKIKYPSELKNRLIILYHMLYMMNIDNQITEEEEKACRKLGYYMLGNPPLVNDMINICIQHSKDGIPEGEFLQAIKKYMN